MKKNQMYSGFRVKDIQELPEAHSEVYMLEHVKSGARLLYMKSEDDNKVFSISFRTPPHDDAGLPHILEHSVLCGSRKYPLKEPFVELVKGSLNTFVNAMTFPDKTMYPVASRNAKDFRNLMDVYLDAVLYPNIYENKYTLAQEGWHYELLSEDAPLEYKGVVYNEMKGVYSSPDAVLEQSAMQSLFPGTPYGFESGGYPDAIPTLTQEAFEAFHSQYYHPANSYIFLYGDMDIEDDLAFIDREYLSAFDRIQVDSAMPAETMPARTADKTAYYPLSSGENPVDKTFFSWNAVVGQNLLPEQYFAFQLLQHYLLETPAAPLKKALIDAGVAKEISGSFTHSLLQPIFTVRASGAQPENKDQFVSVIYKTLQDITIAGIDKEMLAASLNLMEFLLREADFGAYPKGLVYAISCMDSWLYDGDPLQYLRYDSVLKNLREKMNGRYYESLIENYLLDNTHRAIIALLPKEGLQEEKEALLREKLAAIKQGWSKEEITVCLGNTQKLLELQGAVDSPEMLAKIPLLARGDIGKTAEKIDYKTSRADDIDWLYLDKFTNKIAYIKLCFDANVLPEELVPYAHVLKELLGRIDTKNYSYAKLSQQINFYTGGIGCNLSTAWHKDDADKYAARFTVSGKALLRNIKQLCALMNEITTASLFSDQKRLKELLEESKASWDSELFSRGQDVIIYRLFSYFSRGGRYAEQGLLSYYRFLHALLQEPLTVLAGKLQETASLLFAKDGLMVAYCCEQEDEAVVRGEVTKAFAGLPVTGRSELVCEFARTERNEALITSAQVQHVAAGGNFRKFGHEYTGAMRVTENIMRYDYLWNKIRVKGGAYGANARFDVNGATVFTSYRDPNLADTLAVFDGIPAYLSDFSADEREMAKYVIGTVSQLDRPLTPSLQLDKAVGLFLRGITYDMLQKEREEVLNATVGEIQKLAGPVKDLLSSGYRCAMGGEGKIKTDAANFDTLITALPESK